jgi:TetR/AcrR family transcriptional regulator, transcriptional repressor for nem operon
MARYAKGHKTATRERILDVASKRFRKDGAERVGIAGLMAGAGLTHGGFYSHFRSKEELIREAVAGSLDHSRARLTRIAQTDADGFEAIVRSYLHAWHRENPERGCAAASLAPEIARYSRQTRAAFENKIRGLIEVIAAQLSGSDEDARRQRAIAIFALLMGALQLSRAVADQKLSDTILKSGVDAALTLGRCGRQ